MWSRAEKENDWLCNETELENIIKENHKVLLEETKTVNDSTNHKMCVMFYGGIRFLFMRDNCM